MELRKLRQFEVALPSEILFTLHENSPENKRKMPSFRLNNQIKSEYISNIHLGTTILKLFQSGPRFSLLEYFSSYRFPLISACQIFLRLRLHDSRNLCSAIVNYHNLYIF